jgi:hypothetical protein
VTFRKGVSGNRAGKPVGAPHRLTLEGRRLASREGPAVLKKIVADAKAGEPFAQRLFMQFLYPRSKLVEAPVEREPIITTEDAAKRIAETLARMEAGALDLDEAQATAALAQAFVATRNVAKLEAEAVEMRERIARLRAEIEEMRKP